MTATKTNDVQVMIDPQVFNPVYMPYLSEMARTQIFFGGASSGKSVFVVGQRTVIDLMQGGRNYLICRAVGKYTKKSTWAEVIHVIESWELQSLFAIRVSDMIIECANGYQIIFAGLDDPLKLKSIRPKRGAITDIIVEEATETDRKAIKELKKRQRGGDKSTPKRIVLLFNPIYQDHWIFEEYFSPIGWDENDTEYKADDGSLTILRTWFEHNNFLTEQDKSDLLSETDKYYSDVYTWGKFGVLGNVIFSNWKIADLNNPDDEYYLPKQERDNIRPGLDFGFDPSPAAIGVSHYSKNRKRIYFFDEYYETGVSDEELAKEIERMIGKTTIICDSAEKKSIAKLRSLGVLAVPAKKGPDSVNFGIKWLQGVEIIVDRSCVHMQNELRTFKWKEGPDGKPVMRNGHPVPVDANNHLIDGGLRYAYENDMIESSVNINASITSYIKTNKEKEKRPGF